MSIILIIFSSFVFVSDSSFFNYAYGVDEYLFKLIIPSVDFEKEIYMIGSKFNDVDYNVEILEESDIDNNVYFFAGHSGRGDNCYFNKIKMLEFGDFVYVFLDNKRLVYEVVEKFDIVKVGYFEIDNNISNTLFLITCDGRDCQLIVKGVLINEINL